MKNFGLSLKLGAATALRTRKPAALESDSVMPSENNLKRRQAATLQYVEKVEGEVNSE